MGYRDRYGKREEAPDSIREKDTVGKTENVFTRNVRLITSLIVVGLFLAAFIPIGVLQINKLTKRPVTEGVSMTESDLIRLSETETALTLRDILPYRGERKDNKFDTYYYIHIGERYLALAVADRSSQRLVYFTLTDLESGSKADILTDDIRAFFKGYPQPAPEQAT